MSAFGHGPSDAGALVVWDDRTRLGAVVRMPAVHVCADGRRTPMLVNHALWPVKVANPRGLPGGCQACPQTAQ